MRAVPEDKGAYESLGVLPKGCQFSSGCQKIAWVLCCLPGAPETDKLIPRVLSLRLRAKHEAMSAGEGFGLPRSECFTSCINDGV